MSIYYSLMIGVPFIIFTIVLFYMLITDKDESRKHGAQYPILKYLWSLLKEIIKTMNEYLSIGLIVVLAVGFLGVLISTFKSGNNELKNLESENLIQV